MKNSNAGAYNVKLFKDDDDCLMETANDPRHFLSLPTQSAEFNSGIPSGRQNAPANMGAARAQNNVSLNVTASPVMNRVSAALAARAKADSQQMEQSYGNGLQVDDSYVNRSLNSAFDDNTGASTDFESSNGASNPTEDMIARTQKFLNRKLGAGAGGSHASSHTNRMQQGPPPSLALPSSIESVESNDYKSAAEMALALASAAFNRQNNQNNSKAANMAPHGGQQPANFAYHDDQNSVPIGAVRSSHPKPAMPANLGMFTNSNTSDNDYNSYSALAQAVDSNVDGDYSEDEPSEVSQSLPGSGRASSAEGAPVRVAKASGAVSGLSYKIPDGPSGSSGEKPSVSKKPIVRANNRPDSGSENIQLPRIGSNGTLGSNASNGGGSGKMRTSKQGK